MFDLTVHVNIKCTRCFSLTQIYKYSITICGAHVILSLLWWLFNGKLMFWHWLNCNCTLFQWFEASGDDNVYIFFVLLQIVLTEILYELSFFHCLSCNFQNEKTYSAWFIANTNVTCLQHIFAYICHFYGYYQ